MSDLPPVDISNPFHSFVAASAWPSTITDLAQALYDGQGSRLILADALEDHGHQELAQHFRQEDWHPKGVAVRASGPRAIRPTCGDNIPTPKRRKRMTRPQ